jgi:hypothetical protein
MSAHLQGSGPRSNAYSESKFTHWAIYDPFFAEAVSAYKRFDSRLPKSPSFPRIITLAPLAGFIHACTCDQVADRLAKMPSPHIHDLRAVFLLAGRRKQERSWKSKLACYGFYWRCCVFLCAHSFNLGRHNLDSIRDLYLNDVLVHEVAHHVDRHRRTPYDKKESFAYGFVEQQRD